MLYVYWNSNATESDKINNTQFSRRNVIVKNAPITY